MLMYVCEQDGLCGTAGELLCLYLCIYLCIY